MYVYVKSESSLWTVGHYSPAGKWEPESDHSTEAAAAARVRHLNGGNDPAPPAVGSTSTPACLVSAAISCAMARQTLIRVRPLFPASLIDFDTAIIKLSLVEGILEAGLTFGVPASPPPADEPEQFDLPFDLDE